MHLVQILLPVYDNVGRKLPRNTFESIRVLLVEKFQGVTTYSHVPAEGLWKEQDEIMKDQILIYEVMADSWDEPWWQKTKSKLESTFQQKLIVIRRHPVELVGVQELS